MRTDALKLPRIKLPKPTFWDLTAGGIALLGIAIAAVNLFFGLRRAPGVPVSSDLTLAAVLLQLAVSIAGLLVLGKTAKEGTIWGNLLAVIAMGVGIQGILLAAALWAAG